MSIKEYFKHLRITVDKSKEGCVVAVNNTKHERLSNATQLKAISVAIKTMYWFKPITVYYLRDMVYADDSHRYDASDVSIIHYPKYHVGQTVLIHVAASEWRVATVSTIHYNNNIARYICNFAALDTPHSYTEDCMHTYNATLGHE